MTADHKCGAEVLEPGGWHSHTCGKTATIEESGRWWCRRHAPSQVQAREAARAAARAERDAPAVARRDAIVRLTGGRVHPFIDRTTGWLCITLHEADALIECLEES